MTTHEIIALKEYINQLDIKINKQSRDIKKINGRLDNIESELKIIKSKIEENK